MTKRLYRITIRGRLGERFAETFEPLRMEFENGNTVLVGVCVDMSALYGILDHMRDLGLDLWELQSIAIVPEVATR